MSVKTETKGFRGGGGKGSNFLILGRVSYFRFVLKSLTPKYMNMKRINILIKLRRVNRVYDETFMIYED